jgi:hypothetical protein
MKSFPSPWHWWVWVLVTEPHSENDSISTECVRIAFEIELTVIGLFDLGDQVSDNISSIGLDLLSRSRKEFVARGIFGHTDDIVSVEHHCRTTTTTVNKCSVMP